MSFWMSNGTSRTYKKIVDEHFRILVCLSVSTACCGPSFWFSACLRFVSSLMCTKQCKADCLLEPLQLCILLLRLPLCTVSHALDSI